MYSFADNVRREYGCITPKEKEIFTSVVYPVLVYPLHKKYITDVEILQGKEIHSRNESKSVIEIRIKNIIIWLMRADLLYCVQPYMFMEAISKIYKTDRELEGYYITGLTSILYKLNDPEMDKTFDVCFLKDGEEMKMKKLYYLSSKIILEQMESEEKIYLNITKEEFSGLLEQIGNEQKLLAKYSDVLDYLQSYLLHIAINSKRELVDKICRGRD